MYMYLLAEPSKSVGLSQRWFDPLTLVHSPVKSALGEDMAGKDNPMGPYCISSGDKGRA